ncbi:MAG: hypothetical protein IV100_12790 [Myxococcales bacterium]|nr:hypothetical protein [Myxococcales bacterium]
MTLPVPTLAPRPFLVGLFLVTALTLALEVLLTRLLSVITWYSLAFLVIGMGLFGLTAGAVRVYSTPALYGPTRIGAQLARDALLLAAAIPVSYVLLLLVPLRVEPAATTVVLFVVFAGIIALPFIAAGTLVAASLTRTSLPIGRVYAVDLAGAAVGAPSAPLLLGWLDGGSAILAMAVFAALASWCFARSASDPAASRRALVAMVFLGAITGLNAWSDHGLVPLWVKGRPEDRRDLALETWNSHSRVQVSEERVGTPILWGRGKCPQVHVAQRWITIDGDAGTALYRADPDVASLRFLACDVTSAVHHLRPTGPAAIVGVGGSRDLQTALMFGHTPVTGIELNGRLLEVLKGPLGAGAQVADSDHVTLIHDDGRSWLTRSNDTFSVVQMSLVDTWAATGAGAHALGENGLYTVDAWRAMLARLTPDGLYSVSRWYQGGRDETRRLVALAVAALLERGTTRPRDHIAVVSAGAVATLIVGASPLTARDLQRLDDLERRLNFAVRYRPGEGLGVGPDAATLAPILDSPTRAALDAVTLEDELDLRPPTDDRPFFFNLLRMGAWFTTLADDSGGPIEGNRRATLALMLAFLASVVLGVVAIVVPLVLRGRRRCGAPTSPRALLAAGALYFSLIGVGFMLAEIALLQRLGIVLGHPDYSLVVVLSSLVGAAGLGSLLTDRLPVARAPGCYIGPVIIAMVLVALAAGVDAGAAALAPAPLWQRVTVSAGVSALLGIALGTAFPTGMRLFGRALAEETPWLWGMNGVGGVLASSGGIILAHAVGLRSLFLLAAGTYVLLLPLIAFARRTAAGAVRGSDGEAHT